MSRMPLRSALLLLMGGVALLPMSTAAGLAQDAANPTELERIVVKGVVETGTGPIEGYAAKQTTTGSKAAAPINTIPQSVSVVGREQLDDLPGTKADEALRYSAGVNPSTYGTDADTDWLSIRGYQADQTGMFLDGLPLYQTGFGTFLIDPFLLERVEVLKGPASVLYGGANVGGIVNYVGKRPTGGPIRYTEAGVNNFGNAYLGFDFGDALGEEGSASYRVTGKVSGGGWETNEAQDLRGVIAPSVTFTPDAATKLTLHGSYQRVDLTHTSTGFLPYVGTVVDAPGLGRIPRDLFYGEPGSDVYDRQQTMLGYEFEHLLNEDWTIRQNLRYATVSLEEDSILSAGFLSSPTELGRYRFVHDTFVNTLGVDTQLEGEVETGPLSHDLLLGVDYKYYSIDHEQGSGFPAPSLDVLNPVYGAAIPAASTYLDQVLSMNQLGLYAQDQIRFGDGFIATLNGRYDLLSLDLDNQLAGTTTQSEYGAFSGRVGLGYEFDNGLTPYVSYATSFNPTLSTDAAGNLFEPETGRQIEAGIKYEPAFFDGSITASVFEITRDNVVGPDPSNPLLQAAVGEVRTRGFEVEAQGNVTADLKVIGALTMLEAEVIQAAGSTPAGNTPVQIPELTASLWVDYTIPEGVLEGVSLGAGIRHIGESWADAANTRSVPSATLLDAAIRYEQENWGLALKVSNILDTTYVASCQSLSSCAYGAGRTATLSAHFKW